MSYDVYLKGAPCTLCKHNPPEPDLPDPTYNLGPIFTLALTGRYDKSDYDDATAKDVPYSLHVLNGRTGKDTIELLTKAVERLEDPKMHDAFAVLLPPNGWGTHGDATQCMVAYLMAARSFPDHVWEIH